MRRRHIRINRRLKMIPQGQLASGSTQAGRAWYAPSEDQRRHQCADEKCPYAGHVGPGANCDGEKSGRSNRDIDELNRRLRRHIRGFDHYAGRGALLISALKDDWAIRKPSSPRVTIAQPTICIKKQGAGEIWGGVRNLSPPPCWLKTAPTTTPSR